MIGVVLRKELMDHWRDRRSVMGALVIPVIGPLILMFTLQMMGDRLADRELEVPVVGAEHAPQVVTFLRGLDAQIVAPPEDPEQAVIEGEVPFVVRFGPDFGPRMTALRSAPVELLVDRSNMKAAQDANRLRRLLAAYSEQVAGQRLIVRGVAPEMAQPLEVREVDLSRPEQLAVQLLGVMPLLLILAAFTGGASVAIDTTAGERERGSLEPLLLQPVSRVRLLLGKWLATCAFALGVLCCTLVGFWLVLRFVDTSDLGMTIAFRPTQALAALGLLAPLAALAGALQMLVSTFARTFKEAQTYLSLFTLLPILPALYLMLNPGSTETWMLLVPAMAQVAAITDALGGASVPAHFFALVWVSSAIYCVVCLAVLARLLKRETIIFGR